MAVMKQTTFLRSIATVSKLKMAPALSLWKSITLNIQQLTELDNTSSRPWSCLHIRDDKHSEWVAFRSL